VLLGFAQQEAKRRGGHTICWVLVAGDRADEDLGIWRKPPAAAAAVVVRAERERERERARAGRTNSPVGELFGREERNRTDLLLDWTWAVNCSNIFFQIFIISFLLLFFSSFY
jgi:hypothetical protein